MVGCPVCDSTDLVAAEERRGALDGRVYRLSTCRNCTAIVSVDDLADVIANGSIEAEQAASSEDFYAVENLAPQFVAEQVAADTRTEFLVEQYPAVPRGIFLDFGAGRGFTAAAATRLFHHSIAYDFNIKTAMKLHPMFPNKERIRLVPDLSGVASFDAICLFHVLEHMPTMRQDMAIIIQKLSKSGAVFFQVPLLRNEYLTRSHFTYMNRYSCEILCRLLRLTVVGIWFDHPTDFMTCIAHK